MVAVAMEVDRAAAAKVAAERAAAETAVEGGGDGGGEGGGEGGGIGGGDEEEKVEMKGSQGGQGAARRWKGRR